MVGFPACLVAATSACNSHMIDVLVFLFENYFDISTHPAPDALVKKLSAIGFDPEEVSEALDWLNELKSVETAAFTCSTRAMRIYTSEESSKLDAESLAFLVFLESAGVVTPPLRELILDRAMALADDPVPLEKLKIITLMVLWSQEQSLEPLIIEELLNAPEEVLLH